MPSNGIAKAIDAQAESFEKERSPDWPQEDDDVADGAEQDQDLSRGRARAPSRSPGVSPEHQLDEQEIPAEVWRDPLDEEEEEPSSKRARLEE